MFNSVKISFLFLTKIINFQRYDTCKYKKLPLWTGSNILNKLPTNIKEASTMKSFNTAKELFIRKMFLQYQGILFPLQIQDLMF